MKALFIHGYNSSSDSTTGAIVSEILKNYGIDTIVPDFDLEDVRGTMEKVHRLSKDVDYIVAHSLGGFYALAETDSLAKIVINPCMIPSKEIPKLGSPSKETIEDWKDAEKTIEDISNEMSGITYGIFGDSDELFSYYSKFKSTYGWTNLSGIDNYIEVSGGHKLSRKSLELALSEAFAYFYTTFRHVQESRLQEHYVNIVKDNDNWNTMTAKWGPEVYDLLNKGYAPIGGILGCNSYEDLKKDSDMWKIKTSHDEVKAVFIYSFKRGGRKLQYCTTDGTPEGKAAFVQIFKDDEKLLDRMFWGEVSGAVEHMATAGGKYASVTIVPNYFAKLMMPEKHIILDPDGIHYKRRIGDTLVTKVMIGSTENLEKILAKN